MTINQVVYNSIRNNSSMNVFNGFYYLVNDNKVKQPYATIYLLDDPKEIDSLCVTDQGQARFACDVYTRTFVKGIDYREIYQGVVKELESQTSNGIKIYKVEIVNIGDRSNTVEGLFQFSFEAIIFWEK